MKNNRILPVLQILLAALCGVVLAFHRSTAPSSGVALFLVGLAAAVVVALFSLAVEGMKKKAGPAPAVMNKAGFALLAAAGFLFLLAAVFSLLQQNVGQVLRVVTAVFAAACGALTLMRLPLRDSGQTAAVYSLLPVFFISYYLLIFYRSNGDNPYLLQFGYEIAVLLAVLLGIYSAVAGRFEKARPRFRSVCCSLGLTFIVQELVYLARQPQAVYTIPGLSIAAMVALLAYALLLCCGLLFPPVQEVFVSEPGEESGDGEKDSDKEEDSDGEDDTPPDEK